jgi:hypothetical protein
LLVSNPPAYLVPVDLGKIAVEQDDVVPVNRHVPEGIGAVERDVDGHSFSPQSFCDGGGEPPMIFSNQNPHVLSLWQANKG